MEAKALPTKECEGIAVFLYSLFCRHGVPNKVQCDQGREFVNSLNSHLFKSVGVKQIISLAYHPQTNGLIERFNQTLQRALLKMVEKNQKEWENYIDSVLFSYRTSKQASTKYSPFFILYGREPRLPTDLTIKVSHFIYCQVCMHAGVSSRNLRGMLTGGGGWGGGALCIMWRL